MNSAAKSETETAPATVPYNPMHDLLELLGERANAVHELHTMQIAADRLLQMEARRVQKEYADFAQLVALLDVEIEAFVRAHPELMPKGKKGIPTAFGTPKLTTTTTLEVNDEPRSLELVIKSLDRQCTKYVRVVPSLDLEALAKLTDEKLLSVGIRRVTEERFSIAPAKVPLAKTVEAVAVITGDKR